MAAFVEIEFNPYIPQLSIIIDGSPPPDFSRLVQYSDEDIWRWGYEIADAIYAEVKDEFSISFTGTSADAEIVRNVCEKCKHCIGFRANDFVVADHLQKRMGKLNQLIKQKGITVYEKSVIDAYFVIPPDFQQYLEDISALDINNLFCAVRVQTMGLKTAFEESDNSVLFILAESAKSGSAYLEKYKTHRPAFVLLLTDDGGGAADITERGWYITTHAEMLFQTIFDCFLQMPLLLAFRRCVYSIKDRSEIKKELQLIQCVEPLINVSVNKEVEVGKSIKIELASEPPGSAIPKLICKIRNQTIATCDGLSVYGKQEGVCVLEVYQAGSKKPFYVEEIQVYRRNRITKLVLTDDTLFLGLKDNIQLGCDYFPADADNANAILWRTSDETIVTVDQSGVLSAVGTGTCRVICTAENVSAQCICTVKPYLEEIQFQFDIEEDILKMTPLQEMEMGIKCIPSDCIDGKLTVISSENNIVNVVNQTLYAKNKGEAIITVYNSSGRISRTLQVIVHKAKKKSGFFSSLFN